MAHFAWRQNNNSWKRAGRDAGNGDTGTAVGPVRDLQTGDAQAASAEGQVMEQSGNLKEFLASSDGRVMPKVLPEERYRLLRLGYVEVRRDGFIGHKSLFVAADEIDRIEDDVLHLSIGATDRSD